MTISESTFGAIAAAARRHAPRLVMLLLLVLIVAYADPAFAQTADPFATAKQKACSFQTSFKTFAGAIGMIGIIACLMLGFFNKLNWRWLATGICVSFALNVVPSIIGMLAGSSGCG